MIKLTIYGEPIAQGRPRFSTVHGRAMAYDPLKSKRYKRDIAIAVKEQYKGPPLDGPIELTLRVYRSIPKSLTKAQRLAALSGLLRPAKKPDGSNYQKGIEDALNGLLWRDDGQIVKATVEKWYSDNPRIEIEVRPA